jgi:hypothetical protein
MAKRRITIEAGKELLGAGEAVLAGSAEHLKMVAQLWDAVARKLVYVANLNGWLYRKYGLTKGVIKDPQSVVDAEYSSSRKVVSFGATHAYVWHDSPKLTEISNREYMERIEKHRVKPRHRKGRRNNFQPLQKTLMADWADTWPNHPEIYQDGDHRVFNLWTEPRIKPCKPEDYQEPRFFLDVVDDFFGQDVAEREWFLNWATYVIEAADRKIPTAPVLISRAEGVGKDYMLTCLKFMVGEPNYVPLKEEHLTGQFNGFLAGATLVAVSELYQQSNRGFTDKVKTWITDEYQTINIKNGPAVPMRNNAHFICASNRSTPMALDPNDRRFFVYESKREMLKGQEHQDYWRPKWKAVKDLDNNGLPNGRMLSWLKRWFKERFEWLERTGEFDTHSAPPMTEAKSNIIEDSKTPFALKVKELLHKGKIPFRASDRSCSLADIETLLKLDDDYKSAPGLHGSQKTNDLGDLGFTKFRETGTGRHRWRAPSWYDPDSRTMFKMSQGVCAFDDLQNEPDELGPSPTEGTSSLHPISRRPPVTEVIPPVTEAPEVIQREPEGTEAKGKPETAKDQLPPEIVSELRSLGIMNRLRM